MDKFFDYFQIAALFLFLLIFTGRALYLCFSRNINPLATGAGKKGMQRLIELLFPVGLIIWVSEVMKYSLHFKFSILPSFLDTLLIDSTIARLAGAAMIASGLIIFMLALFAMGESWRMGIDTRAPGRLVTGGVFSVSRNPVYVFLDLYFFGTFLINGTLVFLIFAVLAAITLHYQILQEEKFLAKTYGQEYRDYRARTGRYLTWKPH